MEEKKEKPEIKWTMDDVNVHVKDDVVESVTCKHCGKDLKFESPVIKQEEMVENEEGILEPQTVTRFNTSPEDVIVHPVHDCPKYGTE